MAIERNIEKSAKWFLGEDKRFPCIVYQTDPVTGDLLVPNVPENILGWGLRFVLRQSPGSADPALITKEVGSGITIVDSAAGHLEIFVEDTDTEGLLEGQYWYSLKRTDAGQETILTFGYAWLRRPTALA